MFSRRNFTRQHLDFSEVWNAGNVALISASDNDDENESDSDDHEGNVAQNQIHLGTEIAQNGDGNSTLGQRYRVPDRFLSYDEEKVFLPLFFHFFPLQSHRLLPRKIRSFFSEEPHLEILAITVRKTDNQSTSINLRSNVHKILWKGYCELNVGCPTILIHSCRSEIFDSLRMEILTRWRLPLPLQKQIPSH